MIDEEEEYVSSDGEDFDENDDYNDENNIAPNRSNPSNRCSKHKFYNKLIKYKFFRNFLMILNNRVGFWNFIIIITLLFIIFTVSYCSHKVN